MALSHDIAVSATPRTRLAQLALDAVLSVDGVLAADAGRRGMHVTVDGARLVRGVRVVAEAGERYSVELGLQARLQPLGPLAERVRERVRTAVAEAGLQDRLGAVSVTFHDVVDAEEAAAAALAAAIPPPDPETRP